MQTTLITLIFVSLIQIIYSVSSSVSVSSSNESNETIVVNEENTFFYFAYGSNLLGKRLRLRNPSAEFYKTAKLEKHRLDFYMISETWNGAVATIVEDDDEEVMGVLWTINASQQKSLDEQEGVALGWYFAKNVTVTTPLGGKILARTYEEIEEPPKLEKGEKVPLDRQPSSTYLEVILLGAIETGLPPEYIAYLISFPTNGNMASEEMRQELGYPF